jgi:cytochrome c-type biogenesis protein CcmE
MAQTTFVGQQGTIRPAAANRRVKFLVGGLVIVVAIAFLIFNALSTAGQYYLTVSELLAKSDTMVGRPARVSGVVVSESVEWNAPELILKFNISDDGGSLPIVFHGPKPDNLTRPGAEAIVEGRLQEDGSFQASRLLVKCPSRYEELQITEVKAVQ